MSAMKDRRPLTPEEKAAAARLKLIYKQAKARYRAEGKTLTHDLVAVSLGWSGQAAVSQYMNANIPLNFEAGAKFARFFGVPLEEISPQLAELLPPAKLDSPNTGRPPASKEEVPLISWVQAGAWQEAIDLYELGDAEKWVLCPVPHSSKTFALTVRGESMHSPGDEFSFRDGDIIHVDPEVPAENNSLVVARLNGDNEATFKQLIIEGDRLYLKALNPSWPNRISELPEDSVISGVVISKTVIYK